MALSGNLGFVPLDEVLRLLARAGQKGALEIQGDNVSGRVFFTSKGISLATTHADHELREHLINSQFVDAQQLGAAEGGVETLKTVAEDKPEFVQLLREMTVESIYQLSHNGSTFEVDEDSVTAYGSPKPFELESILNDAARRADEWAEVEALLSDMAGVIKMKRDLGERTEVTVSRDAWKLLSELGAGSSVSEMASRLGTTEFWTAKVASDLTSRDLLTVADSNVEQPPVAEVTVSTEPPAVEEWIGETEDDVTADTEDGDAETEEEPVDEVQMEEETSFEPADTDEAPIADAPEYTPATDEATESAPSNVGAVDIDPEVDPNESWWVEPDRKAADETTEDGPVASEEDETPPDDRRNRLGMFSPSLAGDDADGDGDVEEDTEAFLEKVFSQLEEPEDQEDDDVEPSEINASDEDGDDESDTSGHGLLRRRRLGSILTDSSKTND